MKLKFKFLPVLFLSLYFNACTGIENSQYYEYLSTSTEAPECLTEYFYFPSIRLSGTAKFFKRGVNLVTQYNSTTGKTDLKNLILGNPLQNALAIRFAEVVIYDSKNKIIQCGLTDSAGNLKAVDGTSEIQLPPTADVISVQVLSRMNVPITSSTNPGKPIFNANVAIKQDKYTNKLYTLAQNLSSNGRDDLGVDLIAYARQTESAEINGGAFNILNSILTTYLYISDNTGVVNTQCLATKLNTYWKAGFNPFQYAYPNSDPSTLSAGSFYAGNDDKSLNISGGRLGNTSIENTDHFDDYVIIHELGHFIEDNCGQLLSPGGPHYVLSRIDPRLAWSEGWANYLAAQVMYNKISDINPEFEGKMVLAGFTSSTDRKWSFFSSTIGFDDSVLNVGNGSGVMFDLKKPGNNPDQWQTGKYAGSSFDKVDGTKYLGEGHFREGAITRGLFKLSNLCGTTCALAAVPFEVFWSAMDNITGVGIPSVKFKSSHDVLEKVKANGAWNANRQSVAESEALHLVSDGAYASGAIDSWVPFGAPLQFKQSLPCTHTNYIQPRSEDPILTATNSDQRYSNHYYTIDFSSIPIIDDISVAFTLVGGGTPTEFDILLFKENYTFNIDYSCSNLDSNGNCLTSFVPTRTTTSDVIRSDRRSGSTISTKKISQLSSLDPNQKYLLNIRAYTPGKTIAPTTQYSYVIKGGVDYLCR